MSMLSIVAFGMTEVIISVEIDLSVGAGTALDACITAIITATLAASLGAPLAVALGIGAVLVVGSVAGLFTGKVKQWLNVPTFITTLGLLTALRGLANMITGGYPIIDLQEGFQFFGAGSFLGVPFAVFVFVGVFIVMHLAMNHTTFGRSVYAVGGNDEATACRASTSTLRRPARLSSPVL